MQPFRFQQHSLERIVRSQLRRRHQQCARAVGPDAAPEARDAFFAAHAEEAADGVVVVTPFGGGESGIVLHANVENVGWIAGDAAEEAGKRGEGDEGGEGGVVGGGGEVLF